MYVYVYMYVDIYTVAGWGLIDVHTNYAGDECSLCVHLVPSREERRAPEQTLGPRSQTPVRTGYIH